MSQIGLGEGTTIESGIEGFFYLIYTKLVATFKQMQLQTCFKLRLYKTRLRYTVVAAFIENVALRKA